MKMKRFNVGDTVGEIRECSSSDMFGCGYTRCIVVGVLDNGKYKVRRGSFIWITDAEKLVDEYTLKLHEI